MDAEYFLSDGVKVHMWQVELSRWREVRDHVNAILDQSFTAKPD